MFEHNNTDLAPLDELAASWTDIDLAAMHRSMRSVLADPAAWADYTLDVCDEARTVYAAELTRRGLEWAAI